MEKRYEIVGKYKAPDWFVAGIKCNVWDSPGQERIIRLVFGYDTVDGLYIDNFRRTWTHAEPIEKAPPVFVVGELVAVWDAGPTYSVGPYGSSQPTVYRLGDGCAWTHCARLSDLDHVPADVDEIMRICEWV
jgi:hypothetical protein